MKDRKGGAFGGERAHMKDRGHLVVREALKGQGGTWWSGGT